MPLVANDLANAMMGQLGEAWQIVKGEPIPSPPGEDARIMFLAIARGLLVYMEQHQNDTIKTIALGGGSAVNVTSLDLNITSP
jgi:Tfp pilus assembly PilM family ATPase